LSIHGYRFTFKHLCWHSITKILRNGPRAHFPFKRPLGRDSTKASKKKAMSSSSQSTDYLSRIHDISLARLKQSEDKSELKQQNIEFMKEVELKKLEVQSKEIEIQERKLLIEERIRKDEELTKLQAMDMDALPEDLRAVYIARRKGLIEFFINNPV
jgi:hypothetical protein